MLVGVGRDEEGVIGVAPSPEMSLEVDGGKLMTAPSSEGKHSSFLGPGEQKRKEEGNQRSIFLLPGRQAV